MKDINLQMAQAARRGDIETMKQCKKRGATKFNWAMAAAASRGETKAMEWCEKKINGEQDTAGAG